MTLLIRPPSTPLVLLVEDEPVLNEMMTMMLEEMGAMVTSMRTAEEGLQALLLHDWSLIITDVRTPGRINGIELAVAARMQLPIAGIIVMSGYHDQLGTPLSPGISFLPKPWPLKGFLELVTRFLQPC